MWLLKSDGRPGAHAGLFCFNREEDTIVEHAKTHGFQPAVRSDNMDSGNPYAQCQVMRHVDAFGAKGFDHHSERQHAFRAFAVD